MLVLTLARKPLDGTVAANVRKHGCGGLNIDGARIGSKADISEVHATRRSDYPQSYEGEGPGWGRSRGGKAGDEVHWKPSDGRFPANLILSHLAGCRQTGTQTVPGYVINRWSDGAKPFGGGAGHEYHQAKEATPETIATWSCVEGCPITISFGGENPISRYFKQIGGLE